ncbi:MAG: signal peptidase I [Clostridia bacterium]|nr:signal peptidase I [Clostridia bacterium]
MPVNMNQTQRENDRQLKGFAAEVYEWLEAIAFALAIVVLMFTFVLRIVSVDGTSMSPTLHDDDRILVSSLFYTPDNNDIVIIVAPLQEEYNKPLVKRVIATEGQSVDIKDGYVFVDGVQLNESFAQIQPEKVGDHQYPVTVPEGHVFVMGDNRNDSFDSRRSELGMVDTNYILGKVIYRIYPFADFGSLY